MTGEALPEQFRVGAALVVEDEQRALDDQPVVDKLPGDRSELRERLQGIREMLGLAPDRRGLLPESDVARLADNPF